MCFSNPFKKKNKNYQTIRTTRDITLTVNYRDYFKKTENTGLNCNICNMKLSDELDAFTHIDKHTDDDIKNHLLKK